MLLDLRFAIKPGRWLRVPANLRMHLSHMSFQGSTLLTQFETE